MQILRSLFHFLRTFLLKNYFTENSNLFEIRSITRPPPEISMQQVKLLHAVANQTPRLHNGDNVSSNPTAVTVRWRFVLDAMAAALDKIYYKKHHSPKLYNLKTNSRVGWQNCQIHLNSLKCQFLVLTIQVLSNQMWPG